MNKLRKVNHISSSPATENGLKQGDALPPSLYNVSLEYNIRRVLQETWNRIWVAPIRYWLMLIVNLGYLKT